MRQSAHFRNLQVLQNWEKWWMHQLVVVPFRKTSSGWKNGTTWTSWRHQRQTQNLPHREEQFHTSTHAGVQTVGKQLGKEGPVAPLDLQADHEPMVHSCGKPGPWFPQLQWAECIQLVQGGDPAPLLSSGDTSGVLCTPLCFPTQDRHWWTGGSPAKGHEMLQELEHLLNRERQRGLGLSSLERWRLRWLNKKPQAHTEVQEILFKLFLLWVSWNWNRLSRNIVYGESKTFLGIILDHLQQLTLF